MVLKISNITSVFNLVNRLFGKVRRKIILFTILFCALAARAQGYLNVDTTEYIEWNEQRPLSWSDYRYIPQEGRGNGVYALTTVFHSVRGGIKNGKPNFQVKVLYVRKKSWTTTLGNAELLAHEKLHFDLAELYGRKIRKQLASLEQQGEARMKTYKANIERLLNDFKITSKTYDEETLHGKIAEAQQEWEEYVSYELARLNKYININMNK